MFLKTIIIIIALSSSLKISAQGKKPIKKAVVKAKQAVGLFTGNYEGLHLGKTVSITMTAIGNILTGTLLMDGETAKIIGTATNSAGKGTIVEDLSGKTYAFTADRQGNALNFNITFPEYNNQILKLKLQKLSVIKQANNGKDREQKLIGTWRNTEVISSGSGQFYSSFSTDYFVKFNADGTALVWTGKSAGGTNDGTIDANGNGKAEKMEWYTVGKSLYFVNPINKQQSAISFYVEPNRMMLSQKDSKKVYQRVN